MTDFYIGQHLVVEQVEEKQNQSVSKIMVKIQRPMRPTIKP
jgi:hypothetical protein